MPFPTLAYVAAFAAPSWISEPDPVIPLSPTGLRLRSRGVILDK